MFIRLFAAISVMSCVPYVTPLADADAIQVILKGKVVMHDGSPLPSPAGIQRHCSDIQGSAPGPLTSNKGEYLWRIDVDNMLTRTCTLEAAIIGYESTKVDISNLSGIINNIKELPPLVLSKTVGDPRIVRNSADDVPPAAIREWRAAMKAGDASNYAELAAQLKGVVAAAPKFARGWHTLGITYELMQMPAEARDAYMHATQVDPKMVVSYVTLSRMDVLVKDWQGAGNAAPGAKKHDGKKTNKME